MTIRLYDSRTREKIEFAPVTPGKVTMYVCGPTVYGNFHIGNARTFIAFDVVRRYFEYRGYDVTFVQNFTDVDDKIIKRADEEGMTAEAVAELYTAQYFEDADRLGVRRASVHPKATEHIPQIVALIETLIERGHAYVIDGDVYFDVASFEAYGGLSGQNLEDLEDGVRIAVDQRLKNPWDFALWKAAKPGEPFWDSPWGHGRPGWHIECSAMAEEYLGDEFDIHAGGRDLIFPHHENEIAQSGGAGHGFAHSWMHVGHLNIQGRKMSKSLGNYRFVRDMLVDYDAEVIRYFLLSAHYRKPINFYRTALEDAKSALERAAIFRDKVERALTDAAPGVDGPGPLADRAQQALDEFAEAMDDDFNTPRAFAVVFDVVRDVNKILDGQESVAVTQDGLRAILDALDTIGDVLGVFRKSAASADNGDTAKLEGALQLLIDLRADARANKDWETADRIRDRLAELNIAIEDSPEGTRWRLLD